MHGVRSRRVAGLTALRVPIVRLPNEAIKCQLLWALLTALFGCTYGRSTRMSVPNGSSGDGSHSAFEAHFNPPASFGSYTPCTYPSPSDIDFKRRCFISDRSYEQHNMCNLDGAVSNTEMDGIVAQLNELFNGKRGRCICDGSTTTMPPTPSTSVPLEETGRTRPYRRGNDSRPHKSEASEPRPRHDRSAPGTSHLCWYKVAFAFMNSLPMPTLPLQPTIQYHELCNATSLPRSSSDGKRPPTTPPPSDASRWTPKKAQMYGAKFAQIMRERWRIGQCGEDMLLLVVVRRPDALGEAEENKTGPVIFTSWGDAVRERTAHLTIESQASLSFLVNHYNKMMADQDKTKLKYYLSGLLEEYFKALSLADQTNVKPNKIRNFAYEDAARLRSKQHIPDWALGAFGGCALLLIVMALGYCLVKSRVRRGASRAKPGADGGRRWKAGFVGEGGGRSQSKPVKPRKRRTKLFPIKSLKLGGGGPQVEQARRGYGAS